MFAGAAASHTRAAALHDAAPNQRPCGHLQVCTAHEGPGHASRQRPLQVSCCCPCCCPPLAFPPTPPPHGVTVTVIILITITIFVMTININAIVVIITIVVIAWPIACALQETSANLWRAGTGEGQHCCSDSLPLQQAPGLAHGAL